MRAIAIWFDDIVEMETRITPLAQIEFLELDLVGMTVRVYHPIDQLATVVQILDPEERSWFPQVRPLEMLPTDLSFEEFVKKHRAWMNGCTNPASVRRSAHEATYE